MEDHDFEQQLSRQPMRQIPNEWRKEIISAANAAVQSDRSSIWRGRHSGLSLRHGLDALLWPSPKAWASLATVWLILIAMNHTNVNRSTTLVPTTPGTASAMITAWKEQQRVLSELIQPVTTAAVEAPRHPTTSPRSERSAGLRTI